MTVVFLDMMLVALHAIMEVLVIGIGVYVIIAGVRGDAGRIMDVLSRLVLRVTLPCLMFTTLTTDFRLGETAYWWMFPLLAVLINITGSLLGWAYVTMDRSVRHRGEFMAMTAFQNGVFLPLALAPIMFGPDRLPHFMTLLFLYNLLSIPTFFTLAVWLVHSHAPVSERFKSLVNPPNVATLLGLAAAMSGLGGHLPSWLIRPMTTIGGMTPQLATIYVGGVITVTLLRARAASWSEPVKATVLKSLVFPSLAAIVVYFLRPPEYVALFLIMESTMPSALMIALITPADEDRQRTVAGGILLSSLASIVSIPVFMGIFAALYW